MKTQNSSLPITGSWIGLMLVLCGLLLPSRAPAGGTWTNLNNPAPGQVSLMLLLSDGTVLAANNTAGFSGTDFGNTWFRLTPDIHGSYINGNWTTLTPAHDTRLFCASQVLTNGLVFVAGGEYGTGGGTAELFDPLANNGAGSWTNINPPTSLLNPTNSPIPDAFADSESVTLPGGQVLIHPVTNNTTMNDLIFDPTALSWSQLGTFSGLQEESSWVKLPGGSILTVDTFYTPGDASHTHSERYIPSSGKWIPDAGLPVNLWADLSGKPADGETGPALLLPNGNAFFLGGSGHTAIYTPSPLGGTNQGSWMPGADIPGGLASADSPAAMMVNGKILCAVAVPPSTNGVFFAPTSFFEYDYAGGTNGNGAFAQVNGPVALTDGDYVYQTTMLDLPDGSVLFANYFTDQFDAQNIYNVLSVYTPDGSPLPAGKPVIRSITTNPDGSYQLVGTGLNGISQGAAYGDDAQMDSNYPLIRMTNSATGSVTYGRTFNWSSTGVQTGTNLVTTEFTVPVSGGIYSLVVVANGIASDPVTFYGPVWVDFNYTVGPENGTYPLPFDTLAQGVRAVATGGTVALRAAGTSSETMTISKPMSIIAVNGPNTIGH